VWTLSHAEAQTLAHHFPDRLQRFRTVINPYVTLAMQTEAPAAAPGAEKHVIAIGRLAPQKRLDALVRAFALIAPGQAHLTLVGDGEERAALETLIKALGVGDRVTLTGFVDNVLPYLMKADLLVLPSIYEGLPAVILEAMAVNCPVLATDCFPAAREILEDAEGCGLIESLQPAKLAAQIQERLAQERPGTLSSLALVYSVDNGITNHVSALTDMLQVPASVGHFAPEPIAAEIVRDVPSAAGG
jgi:glycosyltransferase involved in cell wall biosynthesis